MAKLHIIIPCKDDFGFAQQTLQSILQQSFQDWTCTIVLDQSPIDVAQNIKELTKEKSQFHVIQNFGSGIVDALNTGVKSIENNSPQYIARFDVDDIMPENRMQEMVNALDRNPKVDLVTGNVEYFSEHPISEGYKKYERWINKVNKEEKWFSSIYRECTIASPNWMMRFDTFTKCGGFQNLNYPEDYDLLFRWYKNNIKILGLRATTLLWNEHQNRTSRNSEHYQQKAFFELKLQHWIQLDYDKNLPVLLVGNNQKARITAEILLQKEIPFHWFVKNAECIKDTPLDQPVLDVNKIKEYFPAQALIAFYEEGTQFEKELQYTFGKHRYFVL